MEVKACKHFRDHSHHLQGNEEGKGQGRRSLLLSILLFSFKVDVNQQMENIYLYNICIKTIIFISVKE